jgi:hypothetical protein
MGGRLRSRKDERCPSKDVITLFQWQDDDVRERRECAGTSGPQWKIGPGNAYQNFAAKVTSYIALKISSDFRTN